MPLNEALCPPEIATTLTVPAVCAGVVAEIVVLPVNVRLVAGIPSNSKVVPALNPVPATVTVVPPAVVTLDGETAVTASPGGDGEIGELEPQPEAATAMSAEQSRIEKRERVRGGRTFIVMSATLTPASSRARRMEMWDTAAPFQSPAAVAS